ncbi:MAG: hypothetical protein IKO49_03585, partial [Bacilli bacterium]|nr:hypothetical protein [Bacilli bacterium]
YAHIEVIFPIYEKQFYHYLVPWVVDDLRNKEVVLKTKKEKKKELVMTFFGNTDYLEANEQQIIRDSIERYFEFLFPEATFPHIELGTVKKLATNTVVNTYRKQVRRNILDYVDNNSLFDVIFHYVRGGYKGHEIEEDKGTYTDYEDKLNKLREDILLRPLFPIINDKLKDKKRINYKSFIALKDVQNLNLPDDIKYSGYGIYQTKWEQQMKEKERPHIKRPKPMNAKEYILFNIIDAEKPGTKQKSIDEINKLTIDKRTGDETLESVYQYYLQQRRIKFASQQHKFATPFDSTMDFGDFMNNIGYKDIKKKIALMNINYDGIPVNEIKNEIPIHEKMPTNHFPLKENKQYYLHTVAPKHSYIIDLMFENKQFCYLVAININTRKLFVEPTNFNLETNENETNEDFINKAKESLKSSENVKLALQNIMKQIEKSKKENNKDKRIKHLRGDSESAFKSRIMKQFYDKNGIDFEEVIREPTTKYPEFMFDNHMVKSIRNEKENKWKTEPKHTSLAILDRAIRTIRDLAFNMRVPIIDTKIMNIIVWQYNNAPHSTLSKYAGQPVSPNDVDSNPDLEAFIVRRIQQDNFNIINSSNFDIKPGVKVKVFNNKNDK